MRIRAAAGLGLLLGLSACLDPVGPTYSRPEQPAIPAVYRDAPPMPDAASIADLAWWQVFDDPVLAGLIREAVANNLDLKVAAARVEQAQAQARIVAADNLPQLGYQAEASRESQALLGEPLPGSSRRPSSTYLLSLPITWEIDLWGRLRRADEAARAEILASREARAGVMLTLVGNVAGAYYALLTLDRQRAVAVATAEAYRRTLDLFTVRREGGVGTDIERRSAAAQYDRVRSQVPLFDKRIAQTENQISVLIGRPPGPVPRGRPLERQEMPARIPAGLPSALLERRPDLRQAEARLRAVNARIGIAEANFYPQFSLTGVLGFVGSDIPGILNGTGNMWSLLGGITGPLFTGGRLDAAKARVEAEWDAERATYQQTFLVALREVADALVERRAVDAAWADLASSVGNYEAVVELSTDRYLNGLSPYYEVLLWQERLFPAQLELADVEGQRYLSLVRLYLALGGGWRLGADQWSGLDSVERR